jgi:hypothetical protein
MKTFYDDRGDETVVFEGLEGGGAVGCGGEVFGIVLT